LPDSAGVRRGDRTSVQVLMPGAPYTTMRTAWR
jgi:hypothetical protein